MDEGKNMKTYRIIVTEKTMTSVIVEANTKAQAKAKAVEACQITPPWGSDWESCSDMRAVRCTEVDQDGHPINR